jgi:hypothetical protein
MWTSRRLDVYNVVIIPVYCLLIDQNSVVDNTNAYSVNALAYCIDKWPGRYAERYILT